MNTLECAGLTKSFAAVAALDGADLDIVAGHLTALLGPSGCGKSTLLRVIAGFERPQSGTVSVSGRMVAGTGVHVPPEGRKAGIVPQEQALFPHLSVAANVAYGLGRDSRRTSRVDDMLELCGLGGLGPRMPHELSGGQQQRVALARALAPAPAVVLLDEPFASLDATLRAELRADIAAILRASGQSALLVTHDQDEALSMADTVAVMRDGRIVQHAAPSTIYNCPVDPWVARFVGLANLLDGKMTGRDHVVCSLGNAVRVADRAAGPGGRVKVVVRPEQLRFGTGADAVVQRREYHGHDALVWVELADHAVVMVRTSGGDLPAVHARVSVTCTGEVVVFPDGGAGPVP